MTVKKIKKWEDIKECFTDALLVGNGASIEFHEGFDYRMLWEEAEKEKALITKEIKEIAEKLDTWPNFELLLRKLYTAEVVNDQFGINSDKIKDAYEKIREALINTVNKVHCKHDDVSGRFEKQISFLKNFNTIFSLNYDLLIYWMMLENNDANECQFKDCFDSGDFSDDWEKYRDPFSGEKRILVFYPHGALHLARDRQGKDKKICADGADLLTTIIDEWSDKTSFPLFVAEGTSENKMASIRRSNYLSKIYNEILPKSGPSLVIYGWSMKEKVDNHILNQIAEDEYDRVAVHVHHPTTKNIKKFIDDTDEKLGKGNIKNITYFELN